MRRGVYHEMFIALQRARAELLAAVRGRHTLHAQGGVLRAPKKKVFIDEKGRPWEDPNNEVEYEFEGGDPNCQHERRVPERPDLCATCQATARTVFVDKVVEPNISAMEFEINRLDPMVAPAQHHEHHVSGRVEVEHSQLPPAELISRFGEAFAILGEANLSESYMDRALTGYAQSVLGASGKQIDEIEKAIRQVSDRKAIETTAVELPPSKIKFTIEMCGEGAAKDVWSPIGTFEASNPDSACLAFLAIYLRGKSDDEELRRKLLHKVLPRLRAVAKTVESAK